MIDFDKMTVAEHEQYKEMQRKAELADKLIMHFEKSCMRTGPEVYFYLSAEGVLEEYYERRD